MAPRVEQVSSLMQVVALVLMVLCSSVAAGGRPRKTVMHFYMHNVMKGENRTTVPITAPSGNITHVGFGSAYAIDDLLTRGALQKTKEVGRAQGFYMWDNATVRKSKPCLLLFFTCTFNNNTRHADSSIILQGSVAFALPSREVAIVGGTNRFRLAQGFASLDPVSMSPSSVVLKVSATILH